MKRRDLIKQLTKAGWQLSNGAKHDMVKHPNRPGIKIPIPRHNEINEYTAKEVLKAAGLL